MGIKPRGFVLPSMPKEDEVPAVPPSTSPPPTRIIFDLQFFMFLLLVAVVVLSFAVLVQAASR